MLASHTPEAILLNVLYSALKELTLRVDNTELADGSSPQTYQASAAIAAFEEFDAQSRERRRSNRLPADERYQRDDVFHQLVDTMIYELRRLNYTPTELREAVILAQTIIDRTQPRTIIHVTDQILDR